MIIYRDNRQEFILKNFNKLATMAAVASATYGMAASDVGAEYDASKILPEGCEVFEVGQNVSRASEQELVDAGYPGITVDGKVSSQYEQEHVYRAQQDLKVIGALDANTRICGYAGAITQLAAEKAQGIDAFAGESDQLKVEQSASVNATEACEEIRLTTWAADVLPGSDGDLLLDNGTEAIAVQEALNSNGVNVGNANGIIGPRTLLGFAEFQQREFGESDCLAGSVTLTALGVQKEAPVISVEDKDVDIDKVIVDKSDDTLKAYDGGELVMQTRISHGDDRIYTYEKDGYLYKGRAHTRVGTNQVYRTEGPDYASQTLGGPAGSMGNARFFDGGIAIHQGDVSRPSHACVRVSPANMNQLVDLGFGIGDTVTVQE